MRVGSKWVRVPREYTLVAIPTDRVSSVLESMADSTSSGTRVYVGNLSYNTRWQGLKDHMGQAGEVVHADVLSFPNGRSKGCGIVEYADAASAREAIETLGDTELDGRKIFVREDRETGERATPSSKPAPQRRVERPAADVSGKACYKCGEVGHLARDCPSDAEEGVARPETRACYKCGEFGHLAADCSASTTDMEGRKLFVSNLAYSVAWQDLKDAFGAIGPVQRADVLSMANGRSKGVGVVIMESAQDAQRAIDELEGTLLHNRAISVRLDRY